MQLIDGIGLGSYKDDLHWDGVIACLELCEYIRHHVGADPLSRKLPIRYLPCAVLTIYKSEHSNQINELVAIAVLDPGQPGSRKVLVSAGA